MMKYKRFHLFCGTVLLISELWKQFTLTFYINGGSFNWWYFPFQLCSLPMYCCLIIGLTKRTAFIRILSVFLMDYGLLGGFFAFFDTSGMHYSYTPLTVHSFLWHIALIVIGIITAFSGMSDYSIAGYLKGTFIYIAGCIIALILNLSLYQYGDINMFYISPYYQMQQVVFCQLTRIIGNTPAIWIYIASIIIGGGLLHYGWSLLWKTRKS